MSIFPMAPKDEDTSATYGYDVKKTARRADGTGSWGGAWAGQYYKATQWTRQGERALLFDGVHNAGYWTRKTWNLGQAVSEQSITFNPTNPGDLLPKFTHYEFPIDWNRHAKPVPAHRHLSSRCRNARPSPTAAGRTPRTIRR
jgi:hypothetical protein